VLVVKAGQRNEEGVEKKAGNDGDEEEKQGCN
jgi:hypothetical protein